MFLFSIPLPSKKLKRTSNAMKNVLVIGSTGQIGSELTMKLRGIYGGNIVAGYIPGQEPKGELLESGPSAIVDITNEQQIAETVSKYKVDTIYNLAALLSAVAEAKPQLAWKIGMGGLFNVLEVAREMHCAVFTPSSIGVFGNNTPKDKTPQDTIRNPRTMYGVTKVSGELLRVWIISSASRPSRKTGSAAPPARRSRSRPTPKTISLSIPPASIRSSA